jgi:hypothetical protein
VGAGDLTAPLDACRPEPRALCGCGARDAVLCGQPWFSTRACASWDACATVTWAHPRGQHTTTANSRVSRGTGSGGAHSLTAETARPSNSLFQLLTATVATEARRNTARTQSPARARRSWTPRKTLARLAPRTENTRCAPGEQGRPKKSRRAFTTPMLMQGEYQHSAAGGITQALADRPGAICPPDAWIQMRGGRPTSSCVKSRSGRGRGGES